MLCKFEKIVQFKKKKSHQVLFLINLVLIKLKL